MTGQRRQKAHQAEGGGEEGMTRGVGGADDNSDAEESGAGSDGGRSSSSREAGALAGAVSPPVASADKLVAEAREAQDRKHLAMQALNMLDAFVKTRGPA